MNRLTFIRAGRLCAAALVFGLMTSMASAQGAKKAPSPAQVQLAKEIVTATGQSHMFDPVIPSVMQQAYTNLLQQNPDLQKPLFETMKTLQPEFQKRQAEVVDIMANTYASHFSETEMKEILAFYNTTTGKKLVTELPKVAEESLAQARSWGNQLMEQVMARVREEMKKKGHTI
jgi:hypothetical protein